MITPNEFVRGFKTPESRWARFGPYYAMFPIGFAFDVVNRYSNKGDYIIDPFAGRCSSVYAGGVLGRHSLGIEINPVGWLYGIVKIQPANKESVIDRLSEIYFKRNYFKRSIESMPRFYRLCYCDEVLKFLLAARKHLDWKNNIIDATLMSFLLVYLHGKIGEGLSNQMKMTKSMGIKYSVEWWQKNNFFEPPKINPYDFLLKKIEWRYKKGKPNVTNCQVIYGDSSVELPKIVNRVKNENIKFSLLFTSPPYWSVTDYYIDQWLRLWLLGGSENPIRLKNKHKARFISKENYCSLLENVFGKCSPIMHNDSIIYVRTDKREFTFNSTLRTLKKYFPNHLVQVVPRPFNSKTQTELYGNKTENSGEVDIILARDRTKLLDG